MRTFVRFGLLALIGLAAVPVVLAQPFVRSAEQLPDARFASWIGPGEKENTSEAMLFRRDIELSEVPERFVVHVSADHRYRFFVNDVPVASGPVTSDLARWYYDTVDLAPYLRSGRNQLAAQVWRHGAQSRPPARQISHRLGFIVQGDSEAEQVVNTDVSWRVSPDLGYTPIPHTSQEVGGGYIAGPTDRWDGRRHPWNWRTDAPEGGLWQPATVLGKGNHPGLSTWVVSPWLLYPRQIPLLEERIEPIGRVVHVEPAGGEVSTDWDPETPLEIAAGQRVEWLIDHGVLTVGIPELLLSGGRDAVIRFQYQEALFGPDRRKGNRNEWQGKQMRGYYDEFVADGGEAREYRPSWLRTFRYVKVTVQTGAEPLRIERLRHRFVAYPLVENASFQSDNDSLAGIWQASWRTARLCALETYVDCPYYEQLQYIGDTRMQALISYWVAGDTRLGRKALEDFALSLQPMGLTKSNHPSAAVQIIPPFSLLYVLMLHDYWLVAEETETVRDKLAGARFILDWFLDRIDPTTGLLGPLPYWNHVDGGVEEFKLGAPPGSAEGGSAHISLLLALALDQAGQLMAWAGREDVQQRYQTQASQLKQAVQAACWDPQRELMAETAERRLFTTHTNALAILADAVPVPLAELAEKLHTDTSLVQPTLYYEFYVFEALAKAGLGDRVLERLTRWQTFLDHGLTTFPEHGVESRSDCHAWSAHPMFALLSLTAGVRAAGQGVSSVDVRPNPGTLQQFDAKVPHARGNIVVSYRRDASAERYEIELPEGLSGRFQRHGVQRVLEPGRQQVVVPLVPSP